MWLRNQYIRGRTRIGDAITRSGVERVHFLWFETRNWGDALNSQLIRWISGKPVRSIDINAEWSPTDATKFSEVHTVIGSILQHARENTVVWGTGFMTRHNKVRGKPRKVHAVRGPLSRERLIEQGIDCPQVYGDPGLLVSSFIKPNRPIQRYRLGVIPHYHDYSNPLFWNLRRSDIKIINIKSPIQEFVDQICACDAIVSTSLHGLIAADAYGIPSRWIECSDLVLGQGFKFNDYFLGVGREAEEPFKLTTSTTAYELLRSTRWIVPRVSLRRLLDCCPFKSPNLTLSHAIADN